MSEDQPRTRLSITSWLVLGAIAAVPPMFATAFSMFEDVKWILATVMVGLALLSWGVSTLRGKPLTVVASKLAIFPACLAAYAVVAASWSPVPALGLVHASYWVMIAAVFLMLVAPLGRPPRFGEFSMSIAMGTIGTGVMGLLDAAGASFHTVVWNPSGATGAFDAAEFAVGYYAVSLPILAAGVVRLNGWRRVVVGIAAVLGGLHFGMMGSSTVFAVFGGAVVVATLMVILLQKFERAPILFPSLGAAAVIALLAVGGYFALPPTDSSDANRLPVIHSSKAVVSSGKVRNVEFANRRTETVASLEANNYLFGVALDLFRDDPIVGQGPGGWWAGQTKHPRAGEPFVARMFTQYPAFRSPHSSLLLVLSELGLVGLLLILGWIGAVIGITFKSLVSREEPSNWLTEHWGLTTAAVTGLAISLCTPSIEMVASALPLAGALAMLTRESALLNDLKGLSKETGLQTSDRVWVVTIVLGVFPAILGLALIAMGAVNGGALYQIGLGDHQMLRGGLTKAITAYEKAHDMFPYRGEAPYNEALAMYRMGKGRDSGALLETAVALRPNDARFVYQQGRVFAQVDKFDETLESTRRAIQLFPNHVKARKLAALAYDGNKRFPQAIKELQRVLEQNPPKELRNGINLELANYYQGATKNPRKELEYLEKAIDETRQDIQKRTLEVRRDEVKKQIERERLKREGKPIPKSLFPGETLDAHGGHGHESGNPFDSVKPAQIRNAPKGRPLNPNGPVAPGQR